MSKLYLSWTVSAVAVSVLWTADIAFAQTAGGGQQSPALEEIIVTARKVEENLMTVPMAIAAVTAKDIQAADIKDLNTLALFTPGLWAEYGLSGNTLGRQLTFRGLSVSTGQVFIDGAPYPGTGNPNIGNVERVEVLIGPQSAYFGRSTFEGAVNFISKEPGDTFKGQINGEYGSFGTTDDSASLEGPIVAGKLAVRVFARHYATSGQWANASNPNETFGANAQDSVALTAIATPTDNLKVRVLLDFEDENSGAPASFQIDGNDPNPGVIRGLTCNLGGTFGPYYCGALPKANQLVPSTLSANDVLTPAMQNIFFNNPLHWPTLFNLNFKESYGTHQQTEIGHVNIDYTMPSGWAVSSIIALHETKYQSIDSPDYRDDQSVPNPLYGVVPNVLPYIGYHLLQQSLLYDSSEELRVTSPQDARLRGTAGVNWLYTRTPGSTNEGFEPAAVTFLNSQSRGYTSTPAVFAGLYYDIVHSLTLGAEARYQWDIIEAEEKYPAAGAELKSTFKSFSPRVTLDYKYADNSLIYALWSRGYRPGGFNSQLLGQSGAVLAQLAATGAGIEYQQEKLDNFELGVKSTWLEGRIQTRVDGYYDIWKNGQVPNTLSYNAPNGGVILTTLTTNIGQTNLYGVESQAAFAVTRQLTVNATLDYQTSKFVNYLYVPWAARISAAYANNNVDGNKFPNAPDWTWTLSPTYTDSLSGDWDWFGRLDWKHRGRYYIDATNVAWIAPSDIVDLHVGIKDQSKTLEFYVKNLTNNLQLLDASNGVDASCCTGAGTVIAVRLLLPNKRAFGLKAGYSF